MNLQLAIFPKHSFIISEEKIQLNDWVLKQYNLKNKLNEDNLIVKIVSKALMNPGDKKIIAGMPGLPSLKYSISEEDLKKIKNIFTIEDIRKAYRAGFEWRSDEFLESRSISFANSQPDEDEYIQRLQFKMFDIKVEMICGEIKQCMCSNNDFCLNPIPKIVDDSIEIIKIV